MIQKERERKYVLAIDPGKTIGWTAGIGEDLHVFGENDRVSFMTRLNRMCSTLQPRLHRSVIERFDSRSFTNDAVDTIKLIGAIEWSLEDHFIHVRYVNAADKKRFQRHDNVIRLKTEGLFHASDAEAIRLWDLYYGIW